MNQLIEAKWRIYASVNRANIGPENGLSPDRHQAIIWTDGGILLIGPLGIKFSQIINKIHAFSFKKMHLKMSLGNWRPFCLCLNELMITEIAFVISLQSVMISCEVFSNCWIKSSDKWKQNKNHEWTKIFWKFKLQLSLCLMIWETYRRKDKICVSYTVRCRYKAWYYLYYCSDWNRIYIRIWIHKRQPMPLLNGWTMECLLEKIDWVITALHCYVQGSIRRYSISRNFVIFGMVSFYVNFYLS